MKRTTYYVVTRAVQFGQPLATWKFSIALRWPTPIAAAHETLFIFCASPTRIPVHPEKAVDELWNRATARFGDALHSVSLNDGMVEWVHMIAEPEP